jgi:hypothetical protein
MARGVQPPNLSRALATARASANAMARAGEIALAAGEVIDARSRVIAGALADPTKLADPELVGMVTEKAVAALASWRALSLAVPSMTATTQRWLTAQATIIAEGAAAMVAARTPADWLLTWQSHATRSLSASAQAAEQLISAGTRAYAASLGPIHRKATGNAKRLRAP